jgi:hypothetical protein
VETPEFEDIPNLSLGYASDSIGIWASESALDASHDVKPSLA